MVSTKPIDPDDELAHRHDLDDHEILQIPILLTPTEGGHHPLKQTGRPENSDGAGAGALDLDESGLCCDRLFACLVHRPCL